MIVYVVILAKLGLSDEQIGERVRVLKEGGDPGKVPEPAPEPKTKPSTKPRTDTV
jgi:hypothetical protein